MEVKYARMEVQTGWNTLPECLVFLEFDVNKDVVMEEQLIWFSAVRSFFCYLLFVFVCTGG